MDISQRLGYFGFSNTGFTLKQKRPLQQPHEVQGHGKVAVSDITSIREFKAEFGQVHGHGRHSSRT
jgi:hypothetical protein